MSSRLSLIDFDLHSIVQRGVGVASRSGTATVLLFGFGVTM